MTTNGEVLLRDPTTHPLPNDGVAKVARPRTPEEWKVLEWELSNFVCTGQYGVGLDRILTTYTGNLERETQPAAWVSGFYGSGKSHLVRVLEYLWTDEPLPSRSTPRGLVELPSDVTDALKELTNAGKREGGLWSAAGRLSSGTGSSFRLSFLGVLLGAADLPTDYAPARLVIRLTREGKLEEFKQAIQERGREFQSELRDMYVSPVVGEALLEASPGFAPDEQQARLLLREQYPHVDDISEEELLAVVEDILRLKSTSKTKLPCTLVVLDELQQFISEDPTVTQVVQDLVEACSSRFGSNILFVATGQSALQANTVLKKLQDRFTVRVHLTDTDIEDVVRRVILQKKPDRVPEVGHLLESVSGEIDRHVRGTKIEPTPADREDLVPDYPILPTRRRFWELALRAVDEGGGLLRSQLRTTHEAARQVAGETLGTVIGADFLFEDQEASMLQSGVLLRELDQDIRKLADGSNDGDLRSRLCQLTFLISRLPRETGADAGLRATTEMLADLVVTDLKSGSAELRRTIPELLEDLVEKGMLMKVDEEYRLNTRVGQEWDNDFRLKETAIRGDDARLASQRQDVLSRATTDALGTLTVVQGQSKTPRKGFPYFGDARPQVQDQIPIWIRDGWSTTEAAVRSDAGQGGLEDPVVYVFLPKRSPEDLKRALATLAAAEEVLSARPAETDEAREARRAMDARADSARARLEKLVADLLSETVVLQGGGTTARGGTLRDSALAAVDAAARRLFRNFDEADNAAWGTVLRRAGEGNSSALEALGFTRDAGSHPVCKAILEHIGSGKRGSDIVRHFTSAPYGWPADAVRGALMTLLANELVVARVDGTEQSAKQLTAPKIGVASFVAPEGRPPAPDERLRVRKLCQLAGVACQPGEESAKGSELVLALVALAAGAGGDAPLPEVPATDDLEELRTLNANERVIELAAAGAALEGRIALWRELGERRAAREASWKLFERLLAHAETLEDISEMQGQADAIREQRALLADVDPVAALLGGLAEKLRVRLSAASGEVSTANAEARAALASAPGWSGIAEDQRQQIAGRNGLVDVPTLDLGTNERLLAELDRAPLATWSACLKAVRPSLEAGLLDVARASEPKAVSVKLPSETLRTRDEVHGYLDRARSKLEEAVEQGPVVVS